jgi:hypothetical protein
MLRPHTSMKNEYEGAFLYRFYAGFTQETRCKAKLNATE